MQRSAVASAVRVVYDAASAQRRREFVVTLLVMCLGAVAELMTIGAVLPFLAIISDPSRADRIPFVSWIIRILGGTGKVDLVVVLAILLGAAAVLAGAVRILLTWMSLRFILAFGHDIGDKIYGRMLRQPYQHYVMRNTSDFIAGFDKLQAVIYSLLLPVMQGVTAALISAVIIAMLLYVDPVTASIAAISMLLTYVVVSLASRAKLRESSEVWARTAGARVKVIQEGLGGIRDILLDQSQAVFEKTFSTLDLRYRQTQTINNFISLAPRYLVETASIILIGVIAVYMTHRPGGLVAAIPLLGALAVGAQRLLPLLQQAYNGWSAFRGNQQMLIDIADLLQTPIVTTPPRPRTHSPAAFRDDIVLDRVSFSYTARSYALRDVSFQIAKGQRVGIVGKTGSGKSTLVDILMGLLEPGSGEIRIDGVPLSPDTLAAWQAQIAHVPQMIYLSDSSIASNIAFGEAEDAIDMARVRAAAQQAEIDEFITDLSEGYETLVGERGIRLSGGQRQRLGIARALYKGAKVLIFDEATSALDQATETAIIESIGRLSTDVTLLMIAHRTTTLAGCDRIIRLEDGKVMGIGSYADLAGPSAVAADA